MNYYLIFALQEHSKALNPGSHGAELQISTHEDIRFCKCMCTSWLLALVKWQSPAAIRSSLRPAGFHSAGAVEKSHVSQQGP